MQSSPNPAAGYGGSYLETEVLTATPQKLQLMMIEGAIRFAQRAKRFLDEEQYEPFCEAVIRAEEIVCEIMAVMDPKPAPDLVKKVASVYLFVYRRLMEANMNRDGQKLDEALRILQEERTTWQMVCERLGAKEESAQGDRATFAAASDASPSPQAAAAPAGAPAPDAGYRPPAGNYGTYGPATGPAVTRPPIPPLDTSAAPVEGGFSFEA